jgi:hypothetical protein
MGLVRKKERGKEKIGNTWGYTFGNEIFLKKKNTNRLLLVLYTLIVVEGEKGGKAAPALVTYQELSN